MGGIWLNCRATEYASCRRQHTHRKVNVLNWGGGGGCYAWSRCWEEPRGKGWVLSLHTRSAHCLLRDSGLVAEDKVKATHHYLHWTPAGCAPVHRHSLIDHMGHCSHRLCKPSEQTKPYTTIQLYLHRFSPGEKLPEEGH